MKLNKQALNREECNDGLVVDDIIMAFEKEEIKKTNIKKFIAMWSHVTGDIDYDYEAHQAILYLDTKGLYKLIEIFSYETVWDDFSQRSTPHSMSVFTHTSKSDSYLMKKETVFNKWFYGEWVSVPEFLIKRIYETK